MLLLSLPIKDKIDPAHKKHGMYSLQNGSEIRAGKA